MAITNSIYVVEVKDTRRWLPIRLSTAVHVKREDAKRILAEYTSSEHMRIERYFSESDIRQAIETLGKHSEDCGQYGILCKGCQLKKELGL
jgi:hypothetical protein